MTLTKEQAATSDVQLYPRHGGHRDDPEEGAHHLIDPVFASFDQSFRQK
jgi:hypothetical protein